VANAMTGDGRDGTRGEDNSGADANTSSRGKSIPIGDAAAPSRDGQNPMRDVCVPIGDEAVPGHLSRNSGFIFKICQHVYATSSECATKDRCKILRQKVLEIETNGRRMGEVKSNDNMDKVTDILYDDGLLIITTNVIILEGRPYPIDTIEKWGKYWCYGGQSLLFQIYIQTKGGFFFNKHHPTLRFIECCGTPEALQVKPDWKEMYDGIIKALNQLPIRQELNIKLHNALQNGEKH
jgi:hypothetical protein